MLRPALEVSLFNTWSAAASLCITVDAARRQVFSILTAAMCCFNAPALSSRARRRLMVARKLEAFATSGTPRGRHGFGHVRFVLRSWRECCTAVDGAMVPDTDSCDTRKCLGGLLTCNCFARVYTLAQAPTTNALHPFAESFAALLTRDKKW